MDKPDNLDGWPDPKFHENRNKFPPEELDKYLGLYVAWIPDGTGILDSDPDEMALHERIMTMGEMPEIKYVSVPREDGGFGTGGEAPNSLPPAAVAAAFFDATGVAARRVPLTPAFVQSLLKT